MITIKVASASSIRAADAALSEALPGGSEQRALRLDCNRKANPRAAKPTARYADQVEPIIPATAATAAAMNADLPVSVHSSAEKERPRLPFSDVISLTGRYSSAKARTR